MPGNLPKAQRATLNHDPQMAKNDRVNSNLAVAGKLCFITLKSDEGILTRMSLYRMRPLENKTKSTRRAPEHTKTEKGAISWKR